jgi:kynurenine formamidase
MRIYIDMTHVIEVGMPVWPGEPQPDIQETKSLEKDICAVQNIQLSNHLGTHLDAPCHFIKQGVAIHQIPLETLIGKAIILDFTEKKKDNFITEEDLRAHMELIAPGARVLIKTGWDKYFAPETFYEGFPCLTLDAAEFLASREIRLLGMDTPSPSPVDDPDEMIHKTLLGAGIILLEALKNLALIEQEECDLIVLPPPFKNFSGSPCRVVAVIEK